MLVKSCRGYSERRYPVYVTNERGLKGLDRLVPTTDKRFVVADRVLASRHPRLLESLIVPNTHVEFVHATEQRKTFAGLERLLQWIFEHEPSSDDLIIAAGGGLVLNLAGLAASLAMRGMRVLYVPTTLTAQIDACIGSKLGVNFRGAKNWVGAYSDPEFCYVNPRFLATLTSRELCSQAVEGVKLCLATDAELFEASLSMARGLLGGSLRQVTSFVEQMIDAKLAVLEKDLKEQHYGACMLYGHTLGHAIEMLASPRMSHGEAVALGMLAAARVSKDLALSETDLLAAHSYAVRTLELPERIPMSIDKDDLVQQLRHHKRNAGGQTTFVLLREIGGMACVDGSFFVPVPEGVIDQCIRSGY